METHAQVRGRFGYPRRLKLPCRNERMYMMCIWYFCRHYRLGKNGNAEPNPIACNVQSPRSRNRCIAQVVAHKLLEKKGWVVQKWHVHGKICRRVSPLIKEGKHFMQKWRWWLWKVKPVRIVSVNQNLWASALPDLSDVRVYDFVWRDWRGRGWPVQYTKKNSLVLARTGQGWRPDVLETTKYRNLRHLF